jgi:hypothetical protein
MSFHESAQNIRVEDGHRLVAELQNEEGDWVHAEINLDEILGNDNGMYHPRCRVPHSAISNFYPLPNVSVCADNDHHATGHFQWGGENFSHSAERTFFDIEGDASVPILRAGLRNEEGEVTGADVNLSERIGNDNGSFVFV